MGCRIRIEPTRVVFNLRANFARSNLTDKEFKKWCNRVGK